MECACVIAVHDWVKCAKTAFEEESPKEDTPPVKRHLCVWRYVEPESFRAMQLLVRLKMRRGPWSVSRVGFGLSRRAIINNNK